MWFKLEDRQYLSADTNARLTVNRYGDPAVGNDRWSVNWIPSTGRGALLRGGYRSEEEAWGALQAFMDDLGQEVVELQPPLTDEEFAEQEEIRLENERIQAEQDEIEKEVQK